jgi:multidrug transporter EmrE-like cation transporter
MKSTQTLIVILAGLSVGLADIFIRKAAGGASFYASLKNPWMIAVAALYATQVVFFAYVFTQGWKLGVVGVINMAVYWLVVLLAGRFLFQEILTPLQIGGMALAVLGVALMIR